MLPMIWCRKHYSRLGQRVSGFRLAPTCARGRLSFCATIIFRKCGGPAFEEHGTILPPTGFWPPRQGRKSQDRKRVVTGKSVSVRVGLGGRRLNKQKNTQKQD